LFFPDGAFNYRSMQCILNHITQIVNVHVLVLRQVYYEVQGLKFHLFCCPIDLFRLQDEWIFWNL